MGSNLVLPRGTTGFWRHGCAAAVARLEPEAIERACRLAATRAGWTVEGRDVGLDAVLKSFVQILIRDSMGRRLQLLANLYVPSIAAAAVEEDATGTPVPEYAYRFVPFPFDLQLAELSVLEPAELEQPCSLSSTALLAPAELEQIRYWGPERLGDVIFNLWD